VAPILQGSGDMATASPEKRKNFTHKGLMWTAGYVVIVFMFPILLTQVEEAFGWDIPFFSIGPYSPMSLNEWGDYLTGVLSPVALGWLVAAMLVQSSQLDLQAEQLGKQIEELELQRKELELQREEMQLQRKEMEQARGVWKEQQAEQKRTADAYFEANKIAQRNLLFSLRENLTRSSENFAYLILKSRGYSAKFDAEQLQSVRHLADSITNSIDRFSEVWAQDDIRLYKQSKLCRLYVTRYTAFMEEATKQNLQELLAGPDTDLFHILISLDAISPTT
jgi:hypothetical protein